MGFSLMQRASGRGLSTDTAWTCSTQTGTSYKTVTFGEVALLNTDGRKQKMLLCQDYTPLGLFPLGLFHNLIINVNLDLPTLLECLKILIITRYSVKGGKDILCLRICTCQINIREHMKRFTSK